MCASQKWLSGKKYSAHQKQLPAKIYCLSRMDASQNKWHDQNGFYPKLAVKTGCHKKRYSSQKAAATQMPVQAKSCCHPKKGLLVKVNASQMPLQAKLAASQKGLPAKHGYFVILGVFQDHSLERPV